MYSHYVVVLDLAVDDDRSVQILGVAHTISEATEIFNKNLPEQKEYTKEYGYKVYEETEVRYEAGKYGEHTSLYIQGVN